MEKGQEEEWRMEDWEKESLGEQEKEPTGESAEGGTTEQPIRTWRKTHSGNGGRSQGATHI